MARSAREKTKIAIAKWNPVDGLPFRTVNAYNMVHRLKVGPLDQWRQRALIRRQRQYAELRIAKTAGNSRRPRRNQDRRRFFNREPLRTLLVRM